MFKVNKISFSKRMEKNGLFISFIIALTVVSCTVVLVKHKEKDKRVDKKIEINALSNNRANKN